MMIKKIFSIFLTLLIGLQTLSQSTYALVPSRVYSVNPNVRHLPVNGLTTLGGDFLQTVSPGVVAVNFKNITSSNAGKPMAVWTNAQSFPKEFKLPQGMSIKIDKDALAGKLVKINNAKQKKPSLEAAGIQVGDISSELVLLPDRIQIKEKTTLTFQTNSQLNMIKSQVYGDSEFDSKINQLKSLSRRNGSNKSNLSKLKSINNLESNILKGLGNNPVGLQNIDKLPQSITQINREALLGMQKECKKLKGNNSPMCSLDKVARTLQTADKVVELEENVEFSLIPPSSIGGNHDFIKMDPSDVRITRGQILDIFNNYGLVVSQLDDEGEYPSGAQQSNPPRENPLTEDYCDDKENPVECKKLLDKKNNLTQEVYTKDLLNGFTLGQADSYTWSKTVKVGAFGVYKKLAEASVKFYYSYGVGLRIPIQGAVLVKDSTLDDFRTSNQDYKVRIGLKTLDADAQYYSNVGLKGDPNKNGGDDGQLFEGKEFVLEFGAGIKVDLRVIGDVIDFHQDIGLMSILATYFKDILIDDFGLSNAEVGEMISSNKLDKGKQFTPAFAGANKVNLLNIGATIPIYATAGFQLLSNLTLKSYLGGDIKFNCDSKNTIGGCDGDQRYTDANVSDWGGLPSGQGQGWKLPSGLDDYKWKEYDGTATYKDEGRKSDDLGFYQNYGPKLSNFLYIPKLIVKLFAKGGVKVYLPVLGWESYWTPDVEIFSMEMSSEALALGTHKETNGTIDATTKNKIYATNPVISLVDPDIQISKFNSDTGKGLSSSQVTINTNKSNNTYDMYTIFPANSRVVQQNPYCENAADGRRANGTKREDLDTIRDAPWDDAVATKNFNIRARGCALNGSMTQVVTKRVSLENKAFDVFLFPGGNVGLNQDHWESPVHTYDRIYPMNQNTDKGMKIKYTINGSTPSCSPNGNGDWFEGETVDLLPISKERLTNQFNLILKAVACNSQNKTINKISSRSYTIENNTFDPTILINTSENKVSMNSRYYDHNGYYTYISYSFTNDDPTCNSPVNYIDINGGNGIDYFGLGNKEPSVVAGASIKAKTCIRDPQGTLVFGSNIVTRHSEGADILHVDVVEKPDIISVTPEELGGMFGGFGGNIGPDFIGRLGGLLGGDLSMDGLVGFNTMMADGGFGPDAFGGMSGFGRKSMQGSLFGMAGMVGQGKMTRGTFMTFNNMLASHQINAKGISKLAKLYKDFGVRYMGADTPPDDQDNSYLRCDEDEHTISRYRSNVGRIETVSTCEFGCNDEPRCLTQDEVEQVDASQDSVVSSDGIERQHAFTRFPGCEEKDIIFDGKVWGACNASFNGIGDEGTPYILTYNGQDADATDENGWKYGNLYTEDVSCPAGYRKIKDDDIKDLDYGILLDTLKIPLGGYKKCTKTETHTSYFSYSTSTSCRKYEFQGKGDYAGLFVNAGGNTFVKELGSDFYRTKNFGKDVATPLRCIRVNGPTDQERSVVNDPEQQEFARYESYAYADDGIKRNYAFTRYPGCEEGDIIYDGLVWAACNANHDGIGEDGHTPYQWTYNGQPKGYKNSSGRKYGNLYKYTVTCPDGYRKPTSAEIGHPDNSFAQTLRVPLGGRYTRTSNYYGDNNYTYNGQNQIGYYMATHYERSFFKVVKPNNPSNLASDEPPKNEGGSLRCVRKTPPTREELLREKDHKQCDADDRTLSRYTEAGKKYSTIKTCEFGCLDAACLDEYIEKDHMKCENATLSRYDSNDDKTPTDSKCVYGCYDEQRCNTLEEKVESSYVDYVHAKLGEINQCHVDLYNSQMENIDTTIASFQQSVSNAHTSHDDNKAYKYIKAIEKMQNIKAAVEAKYKSVFGIE